jgi:hypothetical protein
MKADGTASSGRYLDCLKDMISDDEGSGLICGHRTTKMTQARPEPLREPRTLIDAIL